MADAPLNQLSWLGIDKPTLGYRTNTSPVDESPHWVFGSQNTMSTIRGEMEKRPGFARAVESALSVIPGTVVRLFTWRRFSGSFFVMASVTTTDPTGLSQVWKYEVGVDKFFSRIYADTTSTTAQPFDFVTSNNFVFFGNQTTRQNMRKYNGTAISPLYQASLWGLDFPIAAPARALVSATLPPGLTFNGTSLIGTPVTAGNFSVTFTATDLAGDTISQSLPFAIASSFLDWQTASGPIAFGQVGVPYSNSDLKAWGGTAPYVYTVVSGSLPPGLVIDAITGIVSGTPTIAGNFTFALRASDAAAATITRVFSLFIGDPAIAIAPPAPLTATIGVAYTSAIVPSGGSGVYGSAIVSGSLPPGMALDALGNITGTPSASGLYSVTFQVTDSLAVSNQSSVTFTVYSSALTISTQPLPPAGKVGYAYTFTPFASGGTGTTTSTSTNNLASGDWEWVSPQFRTHFEPVTTALSDLIFTGFTPVPSGATILGVEVSADLVSQASTAGVLSQVALFHSGAQIGTAKTPSTPFTTTVTPQTYGGSTDKFGAALTPAIVNDPSFGFAMAVALPDTVRLFIGTPFQMKVYYSYPSAGIVVTASPSAINAQTGYLYGQTFTSIYGHESSMSALSTSTGVFTDEAVQVNVLSSADLQVNGINLYRTTDGGDADPAAMRLVVHLPNVDASYTDSTPDVFLGSQTGPAFYVNDPPQPLNGFVWSNGRIWGVNGAKTWFTGNEEITNGIPAECMSDAINGNFYAWPSQVGGMAVTSNGVDIGIDEQFWQVSGDTLSTFRKSKLLQGGGVRFPINILSVGDAVLWIDTSKQGWSSADGEFGEAIRPDLAALTLEQAFIGFHKSKLYNWLYILDAVKSILYVYNLDLGQWNTPWKFGPRMTAITSGELTEGNIELIAAFDTGHVMYLDPDQFVDDGSQYGEPLKSNLLAIVPGRGSTARNAAEVRKVFQFDMEVSTTLVAGKTGPLPPSTPPPVPQSPSPPPALSMPPPFAVAPGQAIAWAFPQAIALSPTLDTFWGASGTVATLTTLATGELFMEKSRPLGQNFQTALWSDFSLFPAPVPVGGTIVGIYPVMIASANYDQAVQYAKYGTSLNPTNTISGIAFQQPFGTPGGFPNATFATTELYGNSIGTSLSALTGQEIMAMLNQSLFRDGLTDTMTITGVGFAIVYTAPPPPPPPPPPPIPPAPPITFAAGDEFLPRYPEFFACLVDDDPAQTAKEYYYELSQNRCPPQYQDQTFQKRYIIPERWMVDQAVPMGRRIAFWAEWSESDKGWVMMSFDLAWRT